MATDKKQVLIRMHQSNYDKLKAIANKNKRTITNQVEYIVEGFIDKYELKHGTVTPDTGDVINNQQVGNVNSFVNIK